MQWCCLPNHFPLYPPQPSYSLLSPPVPLFDDPHLHVDLLTVHLQPLSPFHTAIISSYLFISP